ncbi:DnaA initiator-associating protein [Quillaja saponaria]|uniref:DnaA initiator-associating protein n=1 Tax=Quillaja saponaria TaxID=32244 RepID=A0AAD7PY03_QUISA|nr:DnaA initiator-associating protein [Quillaja saponaria]
MNDTKGKTSSYLAITEKKTQRPAACVGIFFQLFDWNRWLAKKKLSSKKFLPPARAKQAAKKFKGDEKMPGSKHHLIANENNGGFPITKNGNRSMDIEQKHEMRAPSLVARLMGLESIPSVHRGKTKNASLSDMCDDRKKKLVGNQSESGREDVNLEMGIVKHESRPQKLQKMASYERRAATRIGAEALQIKKGLEAIPPDLLKSSGYDASAVEPLTSEGSCKKCVNLLDEVDCAPNIEEQPACLPSILLNVVNASSLASVQRKSRSLVSSHEHERDVDSQRSQAQLISFVAQRKGKNNIQPSPPCRPQKDESSTISFKHRIRVQDQMSLRSDRILPTSKISNLQSKRVSSAANAAGGTKDFVALNRNLRSRTRPRMPSKVDNSMFDMERRSCNGQDNALPQVRRLVRKRRTSNVSTQVENTDSINSTSMKQRNILCDTLGGKKRNLNAPSVDHPSVKSKSGGLGETDKVNEHKVTDVISFTFNSPLKNKTAIPAEKDEKSMDEATTYIKTPFPLTGDALGALLEQKLKELTYQADEEFDTGAPPKPSTAMILQELISALTAENSICHDRHMVNADLDFTYDTFWFGHEQQSSFCLCQNETRRERLLAVSCDGNHHSPGSILEASFSSSSLDESSGHGLHLDSMDYSYNQSQLSGPDADLFDSATSSNRQKASKEAINDLTNYVPRLLQIVNLSGARYTRSKLAQANDVILNAELLFGNATVQNLDGMRSLFIARFLVDELENFSNAMWTYFKGIMGFEFLKEGSRIQGFLFDCVIEYLELKYCRFCNCGFNAWKKLPVGIKAETLIQEVEQQIKKWACMAGMVPDEIIEMEMSHSLGKWT